ncbi:PTH2-domain-containing protein [Aureobasidium pullulans]|nr:PTH2-domain-containing protein [Aureobasidium pullulans]THW70476.1 PTH2-domain-containing protein [Aureobasidium pullulans]THY13854.1 PTH2-domain-containing protein [Aureobasidium pullulans]THY52196.1 PTH2-domain-containing protein [Aureobasidium pullulans]THZ18213.1 PTH2-domain-containing protein [Aureobasidium pullulans]
MRRRTNVWDPCTDENFAAPVQHVRRPKPEIISNATKQKEEKRRTMESRATEIPSVWAVAFGASVVAGLAGYFLGTASSIGVFGNSSQKRVVSSSEKGHDNSDSDDANASDSELEDSEDDQEVNGFEDSTEECKLVLVVRTDLGMTKGKIAAQCSHATLACYKTLLRQQSPILKRWEGYGQAKVAVQVKSEEELMILQAQAISLGICGQIIHDAGRTQIASGSATVLGVGPAPKSMVDQVTGHLKLL